MVASALLIAAIVVPAVSVLVLLVWSTGLYLSFRSLVLRCDRQQLHPPLVTTTSQPLASTFVHAPRVPPFRFAPAVPSEHMAETVRPHSFLLTDPAPVSKPIRPCPPPKRASQTRFSIATTVSRSGSRVLVRNPSSQNSHASSTSRETKGTTSSSGNGRDGQRGAGTVGAGKERKERIETARKQKKVFGIGDDVEPLPVENEVASREDDARTTGPRKRRSTWSTEDFDRLHLEPIDAIGRNDRSRSTTADASPESAHDDGQTRVLRHGRATYAAGRRISLDVRSETLAGSHHDVMPTTPPRTPQRASPSSEYSLGFHRTVYELLPPESTNPSPVSYHSSSGHLVSRPRTTSAVLGDRTIERLEGRHLAKSAVATPPLPQESVPSADWARERPVNRDSRVSVLEELENYALGLSSPTTTRNLPRLLDHDGPSPDEVSLGQRPISWVRRQDSSGTLPERILGDACLSIANPDLASLRTSQSSMRGSIDRPS
ncbi:hypothetical protein JCM10212_003128 [Sporobolomyces blumeae]